MSRKNIVKSFKMIDSGDLSGDITSSTTSVINLDQASIHIAWTGSSPSGTITVEATNNDIDKNTPTPVWRELDFGSAITVSGNSGSHDIVFSEMPFDAIRVKYTASSSTGSVDATITAKTIGA